MSGLVDGSGGAGGARRTRLDPDERRAQLLALGVAALADNPLEALTIEWLSERAGVSRALLFHYFGSKQGMHHQIVSTARDAMLRATEPDTTLDALARLRDTLERTVAFVREHRATFRSLVRGAASGDPEVRRLTEEARQQQSDRVRQVMLELGADDTPALAVATRAWVALAEQALVDAASDGDAPAEHLVGFLERSAFAVVGALAEEHAGPAGTGGARTPRPQA